MDRYNDKPKLLLPEEERDYEVGYGKPPAEHRFKPGQSGNPRGRPKGAKNKKPKSQNEPFKDIIFEEAYRDITINEGDKRLTIPMAQAVVRAIGVNAIRGNPRSQRLFNEMLTHTEEAKKREHDELLQTMIEYKTSWERELAQRKANGVTGPEPLPHPDDIIIDMNSGEVVIKGPMTAEEKQQKEMFLQRQEEFTEERRKLVAELDDPNSQKHREMIIEEIKTYDNMLDLIDRYLKHERRH